MSTKIEWATETWNPVVGCTKVSPACQNCYALKFAVRLAHNPKLPEETRKKYARTVKKVGGNWEWSGDVSYFLDRIYPYTTWQKPRKIFVVSMGDLFHDSVTSEAIMHIRSSIYNAKRHEFFILTKRPSRLNYFDWSEFDNVLCGVTAEDNNNLGYRWGFLQQVNAVRFLSVEPMLGRVDIATLHIKPDWVICGGETGAGARPLNLDYARLLRDQCRDLGIPFFFKKAGGKIATPPDLQIRELPEVLK